LWHNQPRQAGTVNNQHFWFYSNHEYAQSASYARIVDLRQIPVLGVFIFHSMMQNGIHRLLATLSSTSHQPPRQGLFAGTLCPHYGYEVLIYFDLAFGWGMRGSSQTMNAVLRFVIVNLFISARQKQKWYRKQFGDASIKGRSLMSTSRQSDILETILGSIIPEL
jgi:hypothetical protein